MEPPKAEPITDWRKVMTVLKRRGRAPKANLYNWDLVREKATVFLWRRWDYKLPHATVEDEVQEAILIVEMRRQGGETIRSPLALVIKIAFFRLCNEYRNQWSSKKADLTDITEAEANVIAGVTTVEKQAENTDVVEAIYKCMQKLSPQQQEVFRLHHIEGLSYAEIQTSMNISAATVKEHLHRAVVKIRFLMARKGY